jgi:hypothetical protein
MRIAALFFTDEAKLHVSGHVNRHNFVIWGIEPPGEHWEHEWDGPNVNVWSALTHGRSCRVIVTGAKGRWSYEDTHAVQACYIIIKRLNTVL